MEVVSSIQGAVWWPCGCFGYLRLEPSRISCRDLMHPSVPAVEHAFDPPNSNQDRDYTIPTLPAELQGLRLTCLQTAQGDKRAGGSRLWRFSLMQVR